MNQTALITGASGGIGYELCELFAKAGYELILVARSERKMEAHKAELEQRHGIRVRVIAKDLSMPDAAQEVFEHVRELSLNVDVLINNAGFGDHAAYVASDWDRQHEMVQLNLVALMQLTRLFLPGMAERRAGRILNVASVAAFQPGPYMAVYFASKAFVLSLSEALSFELKGSGVTVTALCPGPTKSGFEATAGEGASKMFNSLQVASAREVAAFGYRALMRGKPVAVHGFSNRIMLFLERFVPRSVVRAISGNMQKPQDC